MFCDWTAGKTDKLWLVAKNSAVPFWILSILDETRNVNLTSVANPGPTPNTNPTYLLTLTLKPGHKHNPNPYPNLTCSGVPIQMSSLLPQKPAYPQARILPITSTPTNDQTEGPMRTDLNSYSY